MPWTRIPKSSNIFHFLPSLYTMDAPFTKTVSLSRSSSSYSLSYVLPASPPSLTFASINKGRRSKRGAGSRLSSESLRVVLRFPLRSTPRRPRVSVHAILVVPRVCVYTYICVRRGGGREERERERGRPCRWKGSKRIGVRGLESCVEILVVVLRDSTFLYALTTTLVSATFLLANQPPPPSSELFFLNSRFASLFLTRQVSRTVGIGGVPGSHWTIRSMYLSAECAKNHYATGG